MVGANHIRTQVWLVSCMTLPALENDELENREKGGWNLLCTYIGIRWDRHEVELVSVLKKTLYYY